ncbi:hypothetical protein JCM8097_002152 [Rhodosporidiobolus ruineniae]
MANKLEKRQSQRRSLLPAMLQPSRPASTASSTSSSSHRRTVSVPVVDTRSTHSRTRSWLPAFLRPAPEPEQAAPAPPPPPPKDAPASRTVQRRSFQPGMGAPRPLGGLYTQTQSKENEKPLPAVRALSPVAEEHFSPVPASMAAEEPHFAFEALPPQRDLQHRLASWDWSSEGSTMSRRESSGGPRGTIYGDEEVFTGALSQDEWPQEEVLQDDRASTPRQDSVEPASPPPQRPRAPSQPFEHVDPQSSYLDIAAIPSTALDDRAINFGNPFSLHQPPASYLSAILPSRPPSMMSFAADPTPSPRPPLTINPHLPPSRKVSNISASVYSSGDASASSSEDEEEDALPTAGPDLQSYFSPITPADLRTPLSGLAISNTPTPTVSSSPKASRRSSRSNSGIYPRRRSSGARPASTSSFSTATASARPSPLFDTEIFSTGASSPSVSSTMDRTSSWQSSAAKTSIDESALLSPRAVKREPLPRSASAPQGVGLWRQDWHMNARLSRYVAREQAPRWEDGALPGEGSSGSEQEISVETQSARIKEYCHRELQRRREERHQRYLVERNEWYGERESEVTFGAAV